MKIAVASGKGGTGKTTVATNLAQVVAADGRIDLSFTPNRAGHFFLTVTVSDEMNRQTCGEVEIIAESQR